MMPYGSNRGGIRYFVNPRGNGRSTAQYACPTDHSRRGERERAAAVLEGGLANALPRLCPARKRCGAPCDWHRTQPKEDGSVPVQGNCRLQGERAPLAALIKSARRG